MLQEISRRTIDLTKYEDTNIEWHNNVLTVRCENGLHIYDFSYNLRCLDKNIDLYKSKIPVSKLSPASELLSQSVTKSRVKNIDLSQMILDPALWPYNKQLMEAAIVVDFDWSPVDFIYNNECVIAVLNSIGNIDLYSQLRHEWIKLDNLSMKMKIEMELNSLIPPFVDSNQLNFKKLKNVVYALETSAICWASNLNEDKSCHFVTAQKNGFIIFWLLKCDNKSVDVSLQLNICENTEEIITMKWIPTTDNQFILICSNVSGQILAYQCQIVNNIVTQLDIHVLWGHKDKMISQYIKYEFYNNNIILACNKHRHLLLQMINKNCNILLQTITNVNDQKITSVIKSKNGIHVSTVNRELFSVKYVVENEILNVNLVPVEMKCIPSVYELYSCVFSTNDAILALALLDRTILCRKRPLKLEIVFYGDVNNFELPLLVSNPTRSLTEMWDFIESLRCKSLKSKALPTFDYNKLYSEAQVDIYYGKVYLIVLTLYINLERTIQNGSKGVLPDTSIESVKSNILACHAVKMMSNLYECCIKDNVDDKYGFECFLMAGIHLELHVQKIKKRMDEVLAPDIVKIFHKKKNSLKFICQCCDEILTGFTCKHGHLNAFCILTFTPIESNEYLYCRSCDVIVKPDLYLDKLKCVYCDLYLNNNCYICS